MIEEDKLKIARMKEWVEALPFYSRVNMRKGLLSQPFENFDRGWHDEVVNKVTLTYQQTKEAQTHVTAEYLPNKMWQNNVETVRADFADAMLNDKQKAGEMLANFWRNNCSQSLVKYPSYSQLTDKEDGELIQSYFLYHVLRDIMTWSEYTEWELVNKLSIPSIGNPFGCFLDNCLLTGANIASRYYADKINALIMDWKYPNVLEIGGGIGILPYFLVSENPDIQYSNYDLPEVLAVNQYFLMMAFPDKKFKLFGDTTDSFDFALLPNFCLPERGDKSCQAIVNIHSMSEMKAETVAEYVRQIRRICAGYFFMENSVFQQKYNETSFNKLDMGIEFRRLYKAPALWHENIYREFLYKRIDE